MNRRKRTENPKDVQYFFRKGEMGKRTAEWTEGKELFQYFRTKVIKRKRAKKKSKNTEKENNADFSGRTASEKEKEAVSAGKIRRFFSAQKSSEKKPYIIGRNSYKKRKKKEKTGCFGGFRIIFGGERFHGRKKPSGRKIGKKKGAF